MNACRIIHAGDTHRSASIRSRLGAGVLLTAGLLAGCSGAGETAAAPADAPAAIEVMIAPVTEHSIARSIRVTGTLAADEQAEVSAEVAGRVIETPVERGSRVPRGAVLVRLSPTEAQAQLIEAEANAAQIEARLGLESASTAFDAERVPEVANAKASFALTEAEFARVQALLAERVVSQSEHDQRRTQMEAARQVLESARNTARQQYQSLLAARARVTLARNALADTIVRAPFAGFVAERRVSVGDFVSRATPVATVVRIQPMRVELTVPEVLVGQIGVGQALSLTVDAYPGRTFDGRVRFVSPTLRADERSLTIEAVVANADGLLKPGMFATAELLRPASETPSLMVPASAVQTVAGTSRVFVIKELRVEERVVAIGQAVDSRVEVASGVSKGEQVAASNLGQLSDGLRVQPRGSLPAKPSTP